MFSQKINYSTVQAIRPIREFVPANAEAILFIDNSELLACLAKDWCEGIMGTRWWWKDIFYGKDVYSAVFAEWNQNPEYIPAALNLLAHTGHAAVFASKIDDPLAYDLTKAVIEKFTLTHIKNTLFISPTETIGSSNLPEDGNHSENHSPAVLFDSFTSANNPWIEVVAAVSAENLTLHQQLFLGLSLTVQQFPTKARSKLFAESVAKWYSDKVDISQSLSSLQTQENLKIASIALNNKPTTNTDTTQSLVQQSIPIVAEPGKKPLLISVPVINHNETDKPKHSIDISLETKENPTPISNPPAPPLKKIVLTPVKSPSPLDIPGEHITTAWGGIFYLINVGIFLELYGDFTMPETPGIELSLWDFLALLGNDLSKGIIQTDPIWPLLTQLANRKSDEAPGANFDPPQTWQIPESWLEPFHGENVPQSDALFTDKPMTGLEHWLSLVIPYVKARLSLTLSNQELPFFFKQQARIRVTPVHFDITMDINNLPIEIRLAGLDRNPGWVPAANRYIRFIYE